MIDILSEINDAVNVIDNTIEDKDYSPWQYEPVDFITFNESEQYLNTFPLSKRQYQDVLNIIGDDPKKLFSPDRFYNLGVLVWGKGAGKDLVISRLFSYIVYILLCLRNPQRFLWLSDETVYMDLMNVARKGSQSKDLFFAFFKESIKKCVWFRDRYIIREEGRKKSVPPTGKKIEGEINIGGSKIEFPKRIRAYAENSAYEGWEGHSLVVFAADELSGFVSAKEVINARAIFRTLSTSANSRATKNFKALGFVFSFPRQAENDITLELYNKSFEPGSKIYGSFAWPWQVKPDYLYSGKTFKFSHPRVGRMLFGDDVPVSIDIPIEVEEDFKFDPIDAMAKYLCCPTNVMDQWVEYPDLFYHGLITSKHDIFITEDYISDVWDEEKGIMEKRIHKKFLGMNIDKVTAKQRTQYVLWLDAAETYCDAVICIGHVEKTEKSEKIVQDSRLKWSPDKTKNIMVSWINLENWLINIIPMHLNVICIGSDYWNALAISEKLKSKYPNIRTGQKNLNGDDYGLLKKFTYTGQIEYHYESTVKQLVSLRRGLYKPQKPNGGFQDEADCMVGVVKLLKGVDAVKLLRMTGIPQAINVPEAVSQNTYPHTSIQTPGMGNPFKSNMDRPYEHRLVNTKDIEGIRRMFGVTNNRFGHRPIKVNKQKEEENTRLPRSVTF